MWVNFIKKELILSFKGYDIIGNYTPGTMPMFSPCRRKFNFYFEWYWTVFLKLSFWNYQFGFERHTEESIYIFKQFAREIYTQKYTLLSYKYTSQLLNSRYVILKAERTPLCDSKSRVNGHSAFKITYRGLRIRPYKPI